MPIGLAGDGFSGEKWIPVDPATQSVIGTVNVTRPPDRFEIPAGPCRVRDDGKVAFNNAGYTGMYARPGNPVVIKDWQTDAFSDCFTFEGPIGDYTTYFYLTGGFATPPGLFSPTQTPHLRVIKINGDNTLIATYVVVGSGDYSAIGAMEAFTVTPAGVLVYREGNNGPTTLLTYKQWDLIGNVALPDLAVYDSSTDPFPHSILALRDGTFIVDYGFTPKLEHRAADWTLLFTYPVPTYPGSGTTPDLTDAAFWRRDTGGPRSWIKMDAATGTTLATIDTATIQAITDTYSGGDVFDLDAMFIAPVDFEVGVSVDCVTLESLENPCNIKSPQYWSAFSTGNGGAGGLGVTRTQAFMPLRDPIGYPSYPAGGVKEPRLIDCSAISRVASDPFTGAWQAQQVTVKFADTDFQMRQLQEELGDITGSSLWIYLTSEARRRVRGVQRLLFRGIVYDDPLTENLTASLTANDFISSSYNLFREDLQIPRRRITSSEFPGAPDSLVNSPTHYGAPIIFGQVVGLHAGAVKLINVGPMTLNSVLYPAVGLLCGHAVKEIEHVYINGVVVPFGDFGVDIWAPGYPGWTTIVPGGHLFNDIGDQRFTLVPLSGTKATDFLAGSVISVNVKGCEDKADGTGDLIEDYFAQYKYMLLQWIVGLYLSGPWLPSPTFSYYPNGTQVCLVNTASFDIAQALSDVYCPGGFKGGFVIGADGRRQSIRQVISNLNLCGGNTMLGFNQYSQLFVRMLDRNLTSFLGGRRTIDWRTDILKDPARTSVPKRDWLTNIIIAQYAQDYTSGNYTTMIRQRNPADTAITRQYPMLRDPTTVQVVADQQLDFITTPPKVYTWSESLCGLRNDVLDGVEVLDYAGPDTNGLAKPSKRLIWIFKQTIDPKTSRVTFSGYDVTSLIGLVYAGAGDFLLTEIT